MKKTSSDFNTFYSKIPNINNIEIIAPQKNGKTVTNYQNKIENKNYVEIGDFIEIDDKNDLDVKSEEMIFDSKM